MDEGTQTVVSKKDGLTVTRAGLQVDFLVMGKVLAAVQVQCLSEKD